MCGAVARALRPMRIGKGNVLAIEINNPASVGDARGTGAAPLIELRDVVFSYAGHTVVDGVSLQVNRGELVALLGPNLSLIHI